MRLNFLQLNSSKTEAVLVGTHIKYLCKTCFFHLRNTAKLHPTLSFPDAEKLVHAFISSRLDYYNTLLIGILRESLQRLLYIQNSSARILMRAHKLDHSTPIFTPFTGSPSQQDLNIRSPSVPEETAHAATFSTVHLSHKHIQAPAPQDKILHHR